MNRKIFLCLILAIFVSAFMCACCGEENTSTADSSVAVSESQADLSEGSPADAPEISENGSQPTENLVSGEVDLDKNTSGETDSSTNTSSESEFSGEGEIEIAPADPVTSEPESGETVEGSDVEPEASSGEVVEGGSTDSYNPDQGVSNDTSANQGTADEPDTNMPETDSNPNGGEAYAPNSDEGESVEGSAGATDPADPEKDAEPSQGESSSAHTGTVVEPYYPEDIYVSEEPIPNGPRPR